MRYTPLNLGRVFKTRAFFSFACVYTLTSEDEGATKKNVSAHKWLYVDVSLPPPRNWKFGIDARKTNYVHTIELSSWIVKEYAFKDTAELCDGLYPTYCG